MDNLNRQNVSSGSPYEPLIGISRAVRIGDFISISGTAPIGPDGETVGIGDPRLQANRCIEIIREALRKAGADLNDVIRTRLILTRIDDWKVVAEVHGEYFKDIRPACTILEVSRFVNSEWLVEIEADAITSNRG
jgi:enamine deaminase RidA (YjgF/YER057c/UK114 family)